MAKPITRDFSLAHEQVLNNAVRAVSNLGYKISSIDKISGLLQFKTRMSLWSFGQDISLLVLDNKNGTCTVNISSKTSLPQVFDWGEASGIAEKVFKEMDKIIKV